MPLLPIAYFPSLHYLKVYFSYSDSVLEIHENFIKQTIRNRSEILTGNGVLRLSVPLVHSSGVKIKTNEILIDYDTNWQLSHWKAIKSAYAASPYFEDYENTIHELIFSNDIFLVDKNRKILEFLISVLELDKTIEYSTSYLEKIDLDFRKTDFLNHAYRVKKYQQVFGYNNIFVSNLSILDLLFSEGPFLRNWILLVEH